MNAPSSYKQVTVKTVPEINEAVCNFLFELDTTGLSEEDDHVTAYFSKDVSSAFLKKSLNAFLHSLQDIFDIDFDISVEVQSIKSRDWREEWKKDLKSIPVGKNIIIKPSWAELPVDAPPCVIELDPEMAFGSGTHATTQLMLNGIEKHIAEGQIVLDVGTGTGILAIAALKLGAERVVGCDVDPIAAQTAKRNVEKNGVADRFLVYSGPIHAVKSQFDVVLVNVDRKVILAILPELQVRVEKGGTCLLSGILDSEEMMIRDACERHNLSIASVHYKDEWLAFETLKV